MSKAVKAVVEAWTNEGPCPEYHRKAQKELHKKWPVLAMAIEKLVMETS